jgi:CheY-like chemotaxis protein
MKKPFRFIFVDDDLIALMLAEKLIKGFNEYTEIITFSSAREVLKFLREECNLMNDLTSTVLITDLHMPEIDGFELLDSIEKIGNTIRAQLHAFVLSAAASLEEVEKVLSYKWVKGFYCKPLSIEEIEQIIKRIQYPD